VWPWPEGWCEVSRNYKSRDLSWCGNDLRCAGKTVVSIVPDQTYAGMWRVAHPDGRLSDMVNRTRAKDAAVTIALGILNREEMTSGGRRRVRAPQPRIPDRAEMNPSPVLGARGSGNKGESREHRLSSIAGVGPQ
jgi:hypothetical protein